jgi:uncharacterized protein YndB with AHSA1/START domain
MKRIIITFLLLLTFDIVLSFAKKSETTTIQEDAGVTVKVKPVKNSMGVLIATGEINATPTEVFDLLWDIPKHKDWMAPIKEATNVSEAALTRVDHIVFHAILPGLKDRDVVSRATITEKTDKRIKFQFKQTESIGPSPSKDYVRLTLREGGWELVAIDDGKKTRATFRIHTDPGVEIAEKVAQNFAAKGIIDVYEAIRGELK